jgi:hypothetical protein
MTVHATPHELRKIAEHLGPIDAELVNSAADEIERLRAALQELGNPPNGWLLPSISKEIARKALELNK